MEMENVVLYRKYRPQNFAEVIGQEHVVQTLQNSLKAGTISHAYLFSGPRGSGKTTIARIFAKAVNCQKPSGAEPCNKCDSCQEIMASRSLDLMEIDAASHTGVDDVRVLIEGIKFSPVKSKYKVFIIDECHQLSKSAANALLKTLEEPPAHAIFILATTEAHKMIPTIISRCQRFDFKRLHTSEIIKKLEFILKKEGIYPVKSAEGSVSQNAKQFDRVKFEPSVLRLIALNARGSFRDAESLLDKCINFTAQDKLISLQEVKDLLGIVDVGQISELVDLIVRHDARGAIAHLNSLVEEGIDLQEFAKTLVFYVRQCLLLKINKSLVNSENSGFSEEEISKMGTQVSSSSEREVQKMLEAFIDAENKMKYATILQLPLELVIVDITHAEKSEAQSAKS